MQSENMANGVEIKKKNPVLKLAVAQIKKLEN
jgi:hypothetical protein